VPKSKHSFSQSKLGAHETLEGTVLVLPGWINEGVPSQKVIPELNRRGFNTIDVRHSRLRMAKDIDKARASDAHSAALLALAETDDPIVHLVTYSKGGQDANNFLKWYADNRERLPYKVHGLGRVAAIGRVGSSISGIPSEAVSTVSNLVNEPRKTSGYLLRSTVNFMQNPGLAVVEGLGCFRNFNGDEIDDLVDSEIVASLDEAYGNRDNVVRMPVGWQGREYDGTHDTPMTDPSIIAETVLRIAS
jgi:hypothetical protein